MIRKENFQKTFYTEGVKIQHFVIEPGQNDCLYIDLT